MKKSFKGQLQADEQQKIRLSTNNGLTGYQIVKFQVVARQPAGVSPEAVVQIFKNEQTSVSFDIDFTDPLLLAAIFYENSNSVNDFGGSAIIFDNEIFNQDIHITCSSTEGPINYYIELEQVKLSKDEATVATLKDMRAGPDTNFGP